MRVKRYVVNALPDALPMIRSELGKDAVILNTKEIRVGGFLGLFRKKKMEVIAAVESGAQPPRPQPSKPRQAAEQAVPAASVVPAVMSNVGSAAGRKPGQSEPAEPQAQKAAAAASETDFASRLQQAQAAVLAQSAYAAQDSRATTAVADPERRMPASDDRMKAAAPPQDAVMTEIRQMKELVLKLARQQGAPAVPEALIALHTRLVGQDVAPAIVERLMEAIERDPVYAEQPDEAVAWRLAEALLTEWMTPYAAQGIQRGDRIVHFVGPTGVGKTTTIAKLAAEQTLKQGRKVGFITSDTYRIAAVDQLRTYANILNVPLEVVFSPAELLRAFKQLGERDLIFMDTAGRNFRNELYVSEVNSLLQSDTASETYLVLSLTGKTKDMEVVADRFAKYGIRKVIFTKYDETDTYGAVVNIALENGMQTAYIACGQNVPDDIEPFRADSFVKQLLGAEAHD